MRVLTVLLVLAACGAPTREPAFEPCRELSRAPLAPADMALGGVTAGELLASLDGEHLATLTYAAGGDTPLSIALGELGAVARVELSEAACGELLAIPARLHFRTDDGSFDETAAIEVYVTEATTSFDVAVDAAALDGTYAPRPEDVDGDHVQLTFTGAFLPDRTTTGSIALTSWSCEGNACGGGGPESIATW